MTCTYTAPGDLANGTGFEVLGGVFVRTAPDGTIELAYYKECTDGTHDWVWIGDPGGTGAPPPTPADLADAARAKAEQALPTVEWHTPAEWNPNQYAYVQVPTYVWVAEELWAPVSATASVGSVWATATATPVRVILDPGDGTAPIVCEGQPPEYVVGTPTEGFPGCGHVYRHSSALAPNGQTYTVNVSLVWEVAWRGSDGSGGDLGDVTTAAAPRELAVAEIQAIVTGA